MGKVFSPEELSGSEVVDTPAAVAPVPQAPAPPGKVFSPEELAGSEVVADHGPAPEPPKDLGRGEAAISTAIQGASLGTGDELRGIGGAIGNALHTVLNEGRLPTKQELKQAYTEERDAERKTVAQAREQYPVQSFATELAGGLVLPIPGAGAKAAAGAVKAVGLGRKALAAAKALAPAAATGAVAGIGYQDSGEGKIASDEDVVKSGLEGAATGAAASGAASLVGKGLQKIFTPRNKEQIKKQVLDEIARNPDGAKVRDTVKKHLEKAGDAIYDELVTGPDAEQVQKIYQSPSAKKGLDMLEPLTQKLGDERSAAYDVFRKAGVDVIDIPNEYVPKIDEAIKKARIKGDKNLADGLTGIKETLLDEAIKTQEAGGQSTMEWLRAHETTLQQAAASKIGGLEDHAAAKLARAVAEKAKDVLNDVFDQKAQQLSKRVGAAAEEGAVEGGAATMAATPAAKTTEDLVQAAKDIRQVNKRFYALLNIRDALEARSVKEGVAGGPAENFVKKVGKLVPVGSGLAGFAFGGAPGAIIGAGVGAAAPAIARGIDRRLTSRALSQLRAAATGRGPDPNGTIKSIAGDLDLPERAVRAVYLQMLGGGS